MKDVRYRLLPVYTNFIKPNREMQALIDRLRGPYAAAFGEKLAIADQLLYRRGNFTGPMDQVICDALRHELDAQIALSPGFRWGTTVCPDCRSPWRICCRKPRSLTPRSMCRT